MQAMNLAFFLGGMYQYSFSHGLSLFFLHQADGFLADRFDNALFICLVGQEIQCPANKKFIHLGKKKVKIDIKDRREFK